MTKLERYQEEAKLVKQQFEKNIQYKNKLNLTSDAEKCIDFYEGRMYVTNSTKPFEKTKFNLIKFHVDGKQANILSKQWKFNFVVNNSMTSTKKVSEFAEFQLKEMKFKQHVKRAVKDGLLKGTYVFYFYWDEESVGELGMIKGGLKCQIIDFNDIALANPNNKEVQEQEWIILRSREKIKSIRDICTTLSEENKKIYIKPDTEINGYNVYKEQDDDMATVYMKFFKQDGEVYFQSFTSQITLTEPTALNPLINERNIEEQIKKEKNVDKNQTIEEYSTDNYNTINQDINNKQPEYDNKYKANLYPFEINTFNDREKCIYGISDVIDLIPNNKMINKLMNINSLYALKAVLNTIVAKKGALGNQIIDPTSVGQILTDYSAEGIQGFYTINQQSVPTQFFELASGMFDFTTTVNRTKELVTAEAIQKDLSGVAIQQVVQEQNKPVQQQQDTLWLSFEKIGKILEMFYKLFYKDVRYTYKYSEADRQLQLENDNLTNYDETTYLGEEIFNGRDYLDTPFTVQVEVGEGTRYSEIMTQQLLNEFYKSGTYSNLTIDQKIQYFSMTDKSMFSKKDVMLRLLNQEKNGIIQQQQTTIEQQQGTIEQLQKRIEQQAVNMKAMYEEFGSKINIYNGELDRLKNEAKVMENNSKTNNTK